MEVYDKFQIANALEEYNELFYKMWDLGSPVFTNEIPTAAVGFDKAGKCVQFKFNPSFYNELTSYEKVFVIAHESLHVILNHGNRLKSQRDSGNSELVNVVQDIAIHEIMFNCFGFDKTKLVHNVFTTFCERSIISKQLSKELPPNLSSEEYYELIAKDPMCKKVKGTMIDDHAGHKKASDGAEYECEEHEQKAIEDLVNKVKQDSKESPKMAGDKPAAIKQYFKVKVKRKKKWESIVRETVQRQITFKHEEQWAYENPRLSLLNRNCMLPHIHACHADSKNKRNIFLFQDTSGSCVKLAERFLKVARSIPLEFFNVEFFCFDTEVYKTDYMKGELQGFGGTAFHPIEQYIQKFIKDNNTAYPQSVFIVTDGYGTYVQPEYPERWHWILSEQNLACIPKECKKYDLREFE